jgi:hypothetical protein
MKKWFVGHIKGGKLVAFQCKDTPTADTHGRIYGAVVGPFKTKRAAMWAENNGPGNPHFQHVNDAERLSKEVQA